MTSIGQLRRMTDEQRTQLLAEYGPVARLRLANLLGYAIEASLNELDELREILNDLSRNVPEPPKLDPEPWYVVEAERRYGNEFIKNDYDGESGREGIVRALAKWKPREGYAQNREDYA